MPRASSRLWKLLLAGSLPAALAGVWPALGWLALALDVCVLAALLIDLRLTERQRTALVRRSMPQRVSRGRPFTLQFELTPASARPVDVLDHWPPEFEPRERCFQLHAQAPSLEL